MQVILYAKERIDSLGTPPDPNLRGFGGEGPKPLAGSALDDAKKKGLEYLDYARKHLEEVRAAYLAKNLELKRARRRLDGLQKPAEAATEPAAASADATPPADLDRRLSDLERKLDLILKAMEKPGREPAKR